MSLTLIILIVVLVAAAIALVVVLILMSGGSLASSGGVVQQQAVSSNLRNLVAAQRSATVRPGDAAGKKAAKVKRNLALAAAAEGEMNKKRTVTSSRLTLEKKLRYARWVITPIQYRAIQAFITAFLFIPAYLHATIFIVIMVVVISPLLVDMFLDRAINKRFNLFDADYPVLLLSYVSLLKTGMNAVQGLEAAARGLDEGCLVRSEVELMIERLRLGLTEEQAISAFGEDINHPELELFVQSLILSRRVGGTLSSTLERLARQVRKRQQFRKQAVAAVGMERSSLYLIALIMGALLMYLIFSSPVLILPALTHPIGKKIFQCGIALIVFGFYWSRKVTEIKI